MAPGSMWMDGSSSAEISACGLYRYLLRRKWRDGKPCAFIMLNPSTADAQQDDPTIRRCLGFARAWGCGELLVVNLFAYRATSPRDLYEASDPVGPDNMGYVKQAVDYAARAYRDAPGLTVCAWGHHGTYLDQDRTVMGWLDQQGIVPMALAMTKDGQPRHPLYLKSDLAPAPYAGRT